MTADELYHLARESKGTSALLFRYFGLDTGDYEWVLPLTKLQRDIWTDMSVGQEEGAHNVALILCYKGELNVELWKKAILAVTEREPVLRRVIVEKDGLVYLAAKKHLQPDIQQLEDAGNVHVPDLLREKVMEPFSEAGCRHVIVKADVDTWYIAYASTQIFADAAAIKAIFKKISAVYSEGKEYPLGCYADHVFDNNEVFDTAEIEAHWRRKLDGVKPLLPAGCPDGDFAAQRLHLEGTVVRNYCREMGITPAVYFKMLFCVLIRYHFEPAADFVILENYHGRKEDQYLDAWLSFYPVPLRFSIDVDNPEECIRYLHQYRHENVPYAKISAGMLAAVHRMEVVPVYNYINLTDNVGHLPGACFLPVENKGGRYELTLLVDDNASGFDLQLHYHSASFGDTLFLDRLAAVSNNLLITRKQSFSKLDFLTDSERNLLQSFNSHSAPLQGELFDDLFRKQVGLTPDNIAVLYNGSSLTYSALHEKAGQLAAHLLSRYAVKKGDVVGVWMERSHYTLISILAIFRLGAIYLPLDNNLPAERRQVMLEDAKPAVLIITSAAIGSIGGFRNVFVADIQLKNLPAVTAEFPFVEGSDLAYIIYTSGSTGKPKGVLIEHLGMANHLLQKVALLGLDETSVVAQNANAGFDISIWQFLSVLLSGGKTIVYADELIADLPSFINQVNEDAVSVLEVVPSYLSLILEHATTWEHLQYLMSTGDVLKAELVRSWLYKFPGVPVINAYGPTEAADDIAHYIITTPPETDIIPAGKPIANVTVSVLDANGHSCAPGRSGELIVSGICVGRGYLHDENATAAAFYVNENGSRSYRTGDIAAWTRDGNILLHGRKDHQLKINGNRIETAEIEHILTRQPGVMDALVLAEQDTGGEKFLAAYVLSPDMELAEQIRGQIAGKLPSYMIPSVIVVVDKWPLDPNGKIDRNALKLKQEEMVVGHYRGPANETEAKLHLLWSEVLGRENISMTASFFDLGGHSLKAMQLLARIYEVFRVRIELKVIFACQTIEALSAVIETRKEKDTGILI